MYFINFVLFIILIIPIYFYIKFAKKQRIPKDLKEIPHTRGWPLIGVMFSFKRPLFNYLFNLKKEHGPIFKVTIGCRDIIVLNTSLIINRSLKDQGNNFSGRWKDISVLISLHSTGIIFQDKEFWEIQRRFVLKVLRDFGLGKQRSNEIVNFECGILLKDIEKSCGKVINTGMFFSKYMVNVISKLVMNKRFERSDPDFVSLTKMLDDALHNGSRAENFLIMYPFLENMLTLSNFLLWLCGRNKMFSEIHHYIKNIIKEHEIRFNQENEGEDLIDIFLKEKHRLDLKNETDHTFTEWQLISLTLELFAAGYETVSTTLSWGMIFLARYQHIQERVLQEIIDFIGPNRSPNILDKKSLHYTQAVMDEIFRRSSVVPLAIPHRVLESTDIDGFFIPKNSVVLANIYGVHHDKDLWEKPFEFYPEHFLTVINDTEKYSPRDELMPFGVGKRQCLGESLARVEFFVFFTSIVQKFVVKFHREISDEEFNEITLGTDGLIRAPSFTDVVFEMRQL